MKTTINTITVLLFLVANLVFAGDFKRNSRSASTSLPDGIEFKAPSAEAMISKLAPVMPKEADFENTVFLSPVKIDQLSPVTPKETEFEEPEVSASVVPFKLAPVTPTEADFTN
jgi:hypothetical protein